MRTKYALLNGSMSIIIFFTTGIMAFIIRSVMLPILGSEIIGLTATFSDLLAFLNLADLGVSGSIGASLYEPIHNKNYSKVKGILLFFKKLYFLCGLLFTVLAIILAIVLKFVFTNPHISTNLVVIYFLLTALNTGLSYFFSYRLIILSTDQRMFKLKLVNVLTRTISTFSKIIILINFKSFTLFLLTDAFFNLVYFLIMNALIKKAYEETEKSIPYIEDGDKIKIFYLIKGFTFHNIANMVLNGTNNLYIAIFSGLTNVALINNYQMIITLMRGIINNFFAGFISSIGDLIAENDNVKQYNVFRIMFFVTSGISIIITVTFINSVQSFISGWVGSKYLVNKDIVYLLAFNFFINSIRPAVEQFKVAAGIFYEDRFVPIIEAVVNTVACLYLGYKFGMVGVVAGNIISTISIVSWQKPYMVFKYIFKVKLMYYFIDLLKYLFIGIICLIVSSTLCVLVDVTNFWNKFLLQVGISIMVSSGIFILFFYKTSMRSELYAYCQKIFRLKKKIV